MNKVHVLDCTLRDGGYCNQWKFGFSNIKKIISGLTSANIDIIECGFLSNSIDYAVDVSKFKKIEQISSVIPNKRNNTMYVAMANYGDFDVTTLPVCNHSSIDGIRVAFHKKDYKYYYHN